MNQSPEPAAEDLPPELTHEMRALLAEFDRARSLRRRVRRGRHRAADGTGHSGRRGRELRSGVPGRPTGRIRSMTGPLYDSEDVHDDDSAWDDEERDRE